jgi:hypothetical protein
MYLLASIITGFDDSFQFDEAKVPSGTRETPAMMANQTKRRTTRLGLNIMRVENERLAWQDAKYTMSAASLLAHGLVNVWRLVYLPTRRQQPRTAKIPQ